MHGLLVLGFAAAFGAFWLIGSRYKAGDGPFDRLPPGVPRTPERKRAETVADGTRYSVYDWSLPDGRSFHVVEVEDKSNPAWLSFYADRVTGKRSLYMSLARAGDLSDLRKDWAL